MPMAARVGDMTAHGSPLGPGTGSLTVLIGGQPAWRATADLHNCPLSSPNPHGGGTVAKGSLTVQINKLAAARQGDVIVEAGPPNTIVKGCLTVLIGG